MKAGIIYCSPFHRERYPEREISVEEFLVRKIEKVDLQVNNGVREIRSRGNTVTQQGSDQKKKKKKIVPGLSLIHI